MDGDCSVRCSSLLVSLIGLDDGGDLHDLLSHEFLAYPQTTFRRVSRQTIAEEHHDNQNPMFLVTATRLIIGVSDPKPSAPKRRGSGYCAGGTAQPEADNGGVEGSSRPWLFGYFTNPVDVGTLRNSAK